MLDGLPGRGIAGIFAPDLIVGLENAAQHDPQSVLRSRRQHDLVGVASQPSRQQKVVGDRSPKLAIASRIATVKMFSAECAHPPSCK
jgi:hypothetical protein